jgi:hypothetical protein
MRSTCCFRARSMSARPAVSLARERLDLELLAFGAFAVAGRHPLRDVVEVDRRPSGATGDRFPIRGMS